GDGIDVGVWLGSASVMHMPTGLFVSGGLARAESDRFDSAVIPGLSYKLRQDGFWVMAGIEKNFFGPGTTTLFGEYGEVNHSSSAKAFSSNLEGGNADLIALADGSYWGLGVVQRIDSAATDLYLKYRHVEVGNGAANCCGQPVP